MCPHSVCRMVAGSTAPFIGLMRLENVIGVEAEAYSKPAAFMRFIKSFLGRVLSIMTQPNPE